MATFCCRRRAGELRAHAYSSRVLMYSKIGGSEETISTFRIAMEIAFESEFIQVQSSRPLGIAGDALIWIKVNLLI